MYNIRTFIENKINRSNERSTNAIKNIIASFGIKGVSIIVQLLLVPMTINYVNPTQYGIWLTLSSIIGWISFFDIGFGNGLRNRFAEAKATGDYVKAKAYVSTTYICVGVIFAIVWVLFFCLNFFLDWSKILNAPAQMAKELSIVALIVISFFCLQMVFKLINTVLIADQKPAKSAFFDMTGQAFALIIIFVLTKATQGSLIYLALALGFCPILIMIVSSLWLYNGKYKQFRPKIGLFEKNIVKGIVNLGIKFFFIQIAAIAYYQTTNIIIAQTGNPENVTIYNIAFKYFSIATMLLNIIVTPFWSAYTEAYANKDNLWMKNAYKGLLKVSFSLCIITFVLLLLSSFVYKLWVGNQIIVPVSVSIIVALYIMTNIFNGMQSQILNGTGKIKLQLIVANSGLFLYIPVAIFLGKKTGIVGVILPTVVMSISGIILYSIQIRKILNGKASGIWNK